MFVNESGIIGVWLGNATSYVFGDVFLTLLAFVFLLIAFFTAFNVPLEIPLLIIMPLLIIFSIYTSQFLAVAGVILIILAVIIAKNWLF